MRAFFIFNLVLLSFNTYADSSIRCDLKVRVLQDTSTRTIYVNQDGLGEIEKSSLALYGKVLRSYTNDSNAQICSRFKGQSHSFHVDPAPRISLKSKDKVQIQLIMQKDNSTYTPQEVTLIKVLK